jgi:hypothetical protein
MNADNWEHYYTLHQDKIREQRQLEQQQQQLDQQRINAERDERFNSLRPASAIRPPVRYIPGGKRTRQKKRRSKKTRSKK